MTYEYKCVAAPERAKRRRGARGRTERVAAALEDVIRENAVDGWEYMRTDLVPIEEKSTWFSRAHEVHRAVLVFRRGEPASTQRNDIAPSLNAPEPVIEDEPMLKIAASQDVPERPQVSAPRARPPAGLT